VSIPPEYFTSFYFIRMEFELGNIPHLFFTSPFLRKRHISGGRWMVWTRSSSLLFYEERRQMEIPFHTLNLHSPVTPVQLSMDFTPAARLETFYVDSHSFFGEEERSGAFMQKTKWTLATVQFLVILYS
jgi:hypothetical protein